MIVCAAEYICICGTDESGLSLMNLTPRMRFPRDARILLPAEYSNVFNNGKRIATPLLSLHWLFSEKPARLGLAVSRKVDKRAVGRNRIKRILRETMRQLRSQLLNGDYVVVARHAASKATAQQIQQAYLQLLRRAGALPPSFDEGTMPHLIMPFTVNHSSLNS